MSHKKRDKVREEDVVGLKYFDRLRPLLARLHDEGCERDKSGNRELHFDEYCILVLLYMFNPVVSSLRAIQQASELKKVQRKLGCSRASLGSLSESSRVFKAELLREVIAELGAQGGSHGIGPPRPPGTPIQAARVVPLEHLWSQLPPTLRQETLGQLTRILAQRLAPPNNQEAVDE